MKKKLFAFMLSYACIAANSYASLDLSNHLPHSTGIKWCLADSPTELQKPFELMCGDAQQLTSLVEAAREKQADSAPEVAIATSDDSSQRPPVLTQPITTANDTKLSSESSKTSVTNALALTPESIAWAQESIVASVKTVSDFIDEPRRRAFEAVAALLFKKTHSSSSDSIALSIEEFNQGNADPIRQQVISEDYCPYDLSIADNLRVHASTNQSLACQAFAKAFEEQQELKAMQLAISQSERTCSAPSNQVLATISPQVVVKPLQLPTQASAYFVQQIPIDYRIVSNDAAIEASVQQAEINAESDFSKIAESKLDGLFGKSVLPMIDFNRIGFNADIMARSLTLYRYSQMSKSSAFDAVMCEQLPKVSWIKESIYEHGDQAVRQTIAAGLNKLKLSLKQAQSLVEDIEVAISQDESVKVANKQSMNR